MYVLCMYYICPLPLTHFLSVSPWKKTIGILSDLLTNSKHHSHLRLLSLIRSSKKHVIKVYQVRYKLGEKREGVGVLLIPLGYRMQ